MMKKSVSALVLAATLLSGCSTMVIEPIKRGVGRTDSETDYATESLRRGEALGSYEAQPAIRHMNGSWLPVTKVDLPSATEQAALNRMVVINRQFSDLQDLAYYITELSGIPASVNVSAAAAAPAAQTPVATDPSNPAASVAAPAAVPAMPTLSQGPATSSFAYSGTLSGFLDLASARFGVFWEWDKNSVHFFKTKTKTFRLAALPGNTSLSSKVSSKSGGSSAGSGDSTSSGSGSSASTSNESEMSTGVSFSEMSIWESIKTNIEAMLSSSGSISVTPATGTITVTDVPSNLDKVSRFIDEQNAALSRQVVINVRVLSVQLDNEKQYGLNWDAIYENVNKNIGISLGSNFGTSSSSSDLTFSVLSGSSPWAGSSAIINALSTQGHVSQVTSASVVTINNQPAPLQVGRQTSYLASSTTTLSDSGSASSVTLTPGTVTSGFSMSVLPHILGDSRLMLQYSGDLSSLTGLETVTSGDSTIQTPEVDIRNFLQRVVMNSGEILVIAGFEQFDLNGDSQGIGSAENLIGGGGVNTSGGKTAIVVLVQPVIVDGKK